MQIHNSKQIKEKRCQNKLLTLVLGKQKVQKMRQLTILLVGVGGIGCQVLKCLTRMTVKKIVMIDLDVIQVSNLNRQFYFQQKHIGKSKAIVAKEQIRKLIVDDIQIQAIYGSIYDSKWDNYRFYQQFDYVISALDSIKAREYLAKSCTEYGKVMIDAGTAGFYGQSYASVRFVTSCHNCSSVKDDTESMAVCTIRSRPQKTAHCAAYAKHIFTQLFSLPTISDSSHSQFSSHSIITKIKRYFHEKMHLKDNKVEQKEVQLLGRELFDYLFMEQYSQVQEDERKSINLLTFEQAIRGNEEVMYSKNLSMQQDTIWTITQYSLLFIKSFRALAHKFINKLIQQKQLKQSQINNLYDKDDYQCNLFINCLCNLRVYNFLRYFNHQAEKQSNSNNKIKYISLYDCRKLVGNIIPAIASTNAIAAAVQAKQIVDFLSCATHPKYYTISPLNQHKLNNSWLALPNKDCKVCSSSNIYFHIQCDLWNSTFMQFEKFANENCMSFNRDVYCQGLILVKNIKAVSQSVNKKKVLGFKIQLVKEGTLTVEFLPTTGVSDVRVKIVLIHINKLQQQQNKNENESMNKFTILNQPQVDLTISALKHSSNTSNIINIINSPPKSHHNQLQ